MAVLSLWAGFFFAGCIAGFHPIIFVLFQNICNGRIFLADHIMLCHYYRWDKVFKNGPGKIF